MTEIIVAISKVADGSMLNRHNQEDPKVIKNRIAFLRRHKITLEQATRLDVNTLVRATEQDEKEWCRYIEVGKSELGTGMKGPSPDIGDALITRDVNHALILPVADCVGTVIYDPKQQVLMMTHLGRHSLEQNGGEKSVQHLVDHYQSDPTDLQVWLTPAPNKEVFPIWALDNKGMKEITLQQLQAAGVLKDNINDNDADTVTDFDYYSYSEFLKGHRQEDGDHMIIAMMTN